MNVMQVNPFRRERIYDKVNISILKKTKHIVSYRGSWFKIKFVIFFCPDEKNGGIFVNVQEV